MNENKKSVFFGFLLIFAAIGGLIFWGMQQPSGRQSAGWLDENAAIDRQAEIIFFYGRECPHCQDVEKFITDNKIYEKVKFQALEVWHNETNNNFLAEKAEECGIAQNEMGVPFLWSRGKCLIGTPDIEKFFRQEAGLQ